MHIRDITGKLWAFLWDNYRVEHDLLRKAEIDSVAITLGQQTLQDPRTRLAFPSLRTKDIAGVDTRFDREVATDWLVLVVLTTAKELGYVDLPPEPGDVIHSMVCDVIKMAVADNHTTSGIPKRLVLTKGMHQLISDARRGLGDTYMGCKYEIGTDFTIEW